MSLKAMPAMKFLLAAAVLAVAGCSSSSTSPDCCKTCSGSEKSCGNGCIAKTAICKELPGCACNQ